MKNCPYCAEEIQEAAIKCRWCGEFLRTEPGPQETEGGDIAKRLQGRWRATTNREYITVFEPNWTGTEIASNRVRQFHWELLECDRVLRLVMNDRPLEQRMSISFESSDIIRLVLLYHRDGDREFDCRPSPDFINNSKPGFFRSLVEAVTGRHQTEVVLRRVEVNVHSV